MFLFFLFPFRLIIPVALIVWVVSLIRYLYARRWAVRSKELERKRSFIVTSIVCGSILGAFFLLAILVARSIAYM